MEKTNRYSALNAKIDTKRMQMVVMIVFMTYFTPWVGPKGWIFDKKGF